MKTKKSEKIQDLIIDKYYEEIENKVSEKIDCDNTLLEKS